MLHLLHKGSQGHLAKLAARRTGLLVGIATLERARQALMEQRILGGKDRNVQPVELAVSNFLVGARG